MGNNKRICKACGIQYEYCPSCKKYARFPSFMWKCHNEECNDIFNAVSAYKMGVGSKEEIKNVIDSYNIKDYSKFVESIETTLKDLFKVKKEKPKKIEENMDIELEIVDDVVQDYEFTDSADGVSIN